MLPTVPPMEVEDPLDSELQSAGELDVMDSLLEVGDVVMAKASHEAHLDSQEGWYTVAVSTRVRPGEHHGMALQRAVTLANEAVIEMADQAAEEVIEQRERFRQASAEIDAERSRNRRIRN
jgi:hypothetical protein